MKWQSKKKELNVTDDMLSTSVRKKIADYNDYKDALEEQKEALKTVPEKEKKSILSNIETLQTGILNTDAVLVKDMVRLADPKNRERYKNMQARLPKKGTKKAEAVPPVVQTKAAEPVETVPPVEPAAPAATNNEQPAPNNETKPAAATKKIQTPPSPTPPGTTKTAAQKTGIKKSDNTLLIVAGVVITGVLGFFGFRWYMKR